MNGKIYIGQHISSEFDKKYIGSGKSLRRAIKKYGRNNFKCEIIKECENREELNNYEIYYIKKFNSQNKDIGYNITNGGNQISIVPEIAKKISIAQKNNFNHPVKGKELRKILSRANKGKKLSEEHIKKIREKARTRPHTTEEKAAVSQKLKGHKPFWGECLSGELRYKMGSAARGKHWYNNGLIEKYDFECPIGFVKGRLPKSEETKRKISNTNKGRTISQETRMKISLTKIGKNNPQYGKVGTNKGKIKIINNSNISKYIYVSELEKYRSLGYYRPSERSKKHESYIL